jgi:hypothetical protein
MILKNVELMWAKLDPSNPDGGFDGTKPQWNVQIIMRDPAQKQALIDAGLNPKVDEDANGIIYTIRTMKPAFKKNGQAEDPVNVVDMALKPVANLTSIGNGTIANVNIRTFDWTFNGKKGIGQRLAAIQIIELVAYNGGGGDLDGFDVIAVDEDVAGFSAADEDDLY